MTRCTTRWQRAVSVLIADALLRSYATFVLTRFDTHTHAAKVVVDGLIRTTFGDACAKAVGSTPNERTVSALEHISDWVSSA